MLLAEEISTMTQTNHRTGNWKTVKTAQFKAMSFHTCPRCQKHQEDTKEYWEAIHVDSNTTHWVCKRCNTAIFKKEIREGKNQ
jgi:uncharacterized C2H2 Zn-finger protein